MTGDRVTLTVGAQQHEGWQSIRITRGIERAAADFDLTLTRRGPGSEPLRITPGLACQVRIGSATVVTGYLDGVEVSHSPQTVSIQATGRSKTADILDCSADRTPGQVRQRTFEALAGDLCAPYGVAVVAEVPTGEPVAVHTIDPGETVYESLEKIARTRGLLLTDDEQGRLVITRAGERRATTGLVLGQNIRSGQARYNASELFRSYVVKGQRSASDEDFGATVATAQGLAEDLAVLRNRTLVLRTDRKATLATCTQRAQWEAARRLGRSAQVTVTVQGWRQEDGAMWRPNLLTYVQDPILGIDGMMLITEVEHSLDASDGTTTRLQLALPDAYRPEPIPAKARKAVAINYFPELGQ